MDWRVRSRSIPQLPSSMGAAYGGVAAFAGSCETEAVVYASIPVEAAPQGQVDEVVETQRPWITIVWNDPINLMSYVTYLRPVGHASTGRLTSSDDDVRIPTNRDRPRCLAR